MTAQDEINASIFMASFIGLGIGAAGLVFLGTSDFGPSRRWQQVVAWIWVAFWMLPPLGRIWSAMVFL